jgi:hypothetical protein
MHKHHLSVWIMVLLLIAGCASVPTKDIKVDSQADSKANFSGYKSYTWLGAAAIVNDPHGQWEPPQFDADAEIKFLIDRELRKRGMAEDRNAPDLFVAYAAGIDMAALELKADPDTKLEVPQNVPQGGVIIALVDSQTGFVIWLGWATAEVQENPDTATVKARLDYAVTKMLKEIPK